MDINFETHTSAGAESGSARWGRTPMTNDVRVYFDPATREELAAIEMQDGKEVVMGRGSWEALQSAGYRGRLWRNGRGSVHVWHKGCPRTVARLIAKLSGRRIGNRRAIVFKDKDQLNLRLDNMTIQPGPSGAHEAPVRRYGAEAHVLLNDGTRAVFNTNTWREWVRLGLPVPFVRRAGDGSEMLVVNAPGEGGPRSAQVARLVLAITGKAPPKGQGVCQLDGDIRNVRLDNLGLTVNRASKGRDGKLIASLRDCADQLARIEREVAERHGLDDHQRKVSLAWALTTARLLRPDTPVRIAKHVGLSSVLTREMAEVRDTLEDAGIVTAWMPSWHDGQRWAAEIVPEVATASEAAA